MRSKRGQEDGPPAGRLDRDEDPEPAPRPRAGSAVAEGAGLNRLLQALLRVTVALGRPAEAGQILRMVLEQAVFLAQARDGYLALPTADGAALRVRAGVGSPGAQEGQLVPVEGTRAGEAFRTGAIQELRGGSGAGERAEPSPAGRGVVVPVGVEGRPNGVLLLAWPPGAAALPVERSDLLRAFAAAAGAVVENLRRYAELGSEQRLNQWRGGLDLRAWNARYERAARALGSVVFEWDRTADHIVWSGAVQSLLGRDPERLGHSLDAWIASFVEEDRPRLRDAVGEALRWGTVVELSCRLAGAEARARRVRVQMVPSQEPDGEHLLGVLSMEPPVSADRAEESAPLPRDAVRALQHSINNPLAIIMGQAQLLLSDDPAGQPEGQVRAGLETIAQQVQRIARIVQQVAPPPAEGADDPAVPRADLGAGFRAIVEHMADGVLVLDAARAVRYANPAVDAVVGRAAAEAVGRPVEAVFAPGEARERLRAHLESAAGGAAEPVEIELPRPGGEPAWVRLASRPFQLESGEPGWVICTLTDVTRQKRSEAELREIALRDPLTGLPNRALLLERLSHATARAARHVHHQFAVLFLDLDHLKLVNDSFGHTAGDQLLVAFARRLRASIRPEDTVARLGGDEFAILLEGITETADATHVAERILADLVDPIRAAEYEVATSVSIGIVLNSPGYTSSEQLLRDADTAMYRAKSLGRGRYAIFDRAMHRLVTSRLRDEAELKRALDRGEFRLHYQPIVELTTRRLAGLEALLRWEHPERGLLEPAEFIPLAESSNLILPMGQWVLSHACLRLRTWRDRYPEHAPRWMAVNLSSKQFLQPGLLAQLREVLRETSLTPSELRLEIQESTVSSHTGAAHNILHELRSLGVRVNMDDFGTGYSSLGSLLRLPIESLKIDQSVLRDLKMDDQQTRLVRTILTVAEGVGASAIAEGVSTTEQLGELERMGCQYAQGYLFSRPLTAEAVERMLRSAHDGKARP